ncbi:MAG: AAA family ATPase [Bradymonadaceae bacterium]
MWDRFRTCSEADAPKITLLSGEFGVGKSRLGTWLGRRISELGVGRTIVCEHGTDAYESNSLPRMVERFFGTWNLEKSEIATQILQRLETMTGLEADQQLKYESVQLASLAILNKRRPPEDRQTARKLSTEERFEVVTRLLERLGRRRVPVVVFDDVDRSREALDFVDHIGRLDEPPGCFFILTADTDGADPSQLEEPIERLPNAIDFRRVDVSPLAEDHVDRFVRYLLKFEDGSRERLVDISRGYPRVVIDLVVHLIDTDQLRLTDDGYVVPAGDDLNFPDAIRKAYRETIGESLPD